MKKIVCEICGSSDIVKQDGMFVCQSCGTKYSVEDAKKMVIEGPVEVKGTVKVDTSERLQNLYILARRARDNGDSKNALKYYDEIAIEDPNSWEAQFYKLYFSCIDIKIAQMGSSCIRFANGLDNVFEIIDKNVVSAGEKIDAYYEVIEKCQRFYTMILNNITERGNSYSDAEYALNFFKEHGTSAGLFAVKLGDNCAKLEFSDPRVTNLFKECALSNYKTTKVFWPYYDSATVSSIVERIKSIEPSYEYTPNAKSGGCYIATAVYGSYDCPEVWTLRRYRDQTLAQNYFGRIFIFIYYTVSPTIVKLFGKTTWFNALWKRVLDKKVDDLQKQGISSSPYQDKEI